MPDDSWANEIAFSDWLHGNLKRLSDVVGTQLRPHAREARVGGFAADLLAMTTDGRPVIIENQVTKADHKHFGQVLTYAGFYDAAMIIWIAREFRNEYREAIGWLNSLSRKRFLAVELRGTGPSDCAFTTVAPAPSGYHGAIIVPPSRDATDLVEATSYIPAPFAIPVKAEPRMNVSPDQIVRNNLFEDVAARISALGIVRARKPRVDHNFAEFAGGPVKSSHWALTFEGDYAAVALVFDGADSSHERINQIMAKRQEIESRAGLTLKVDVKPLEERIKTKAMVYRYFPVINREGMADEIATWAVTTFAAFHEALESLRVFTDAH